MKIKPTAIAVGLSIVALIFAAISAGSAYAEPAPHAGFRTALGHTVANSHAPIGEFGYEFASGYELTASVMGTSATNRGDQGEVNIISFSRLVRPAWHLFGATNYYRLGVAYVDGAQLVGNTNFRLGIGLEWPGLVQIEYAHWSSAGIHQPNTGLDALMLRFAY